MQREPVMRGKRKKSPKPLDCAGYSRGTWLQVMGPGGAVERPPRPAWITDELLAETIDVWTKAYGRKVGEEEAVGMLVNVGRLAEALLEARREIKR